MTPTSAMVFAAGFGTRMGHLTKTLPKPMLPLRGKPMIDHAIDHLRLAGIKTIVANTHYLPEPLEAHLAQKDVIVCREDTILETGGGLRAALPYLGSGPVVTMNPDALWLGQNPIANVLNAWRDDMTGLLLCTRSDTGSDFDIRDGKISRTGPFRYTGVQILNTDRLKDIKQNAFSLNAYWDLLMQETPLNGYVYEGEWVDIGTAEGLAHANKRFAP